MEDDFWSVLGKFVILAGTFDYGKKLIKWLAKFFKELKSPRRRRVK